MQTRPLSVSTKIALWVFGILFLSFFILPGELINFEKYRARTVSCRDSLKRVGLVVRSYQDSHAGKMPPTLEALTPMIGSQNVFTCPLSGSYEYRFLSKPAHTDVICWDSHPHRPSQTVFVWLNRPNRNVLLADGQVKNMREEEFQRLHLQGQNWTVQ